MFLEFIEWNYFEKSSSEVVRVMLKEENNLRYDFEICLFFLH